MSASSSQFMEAEGSVTEPSIAGGGGAEEKGNAIVKSFEVGIQFGHVAGRSSIIRLVHVVDVAVWLHVILPP